MTSCPYCGAEVATMIRVPDGNGTRIGCSSCRDEGDCPDIAPYDEHNRPPAPGNDFLREVMTYKGTGIL